MKVCVISFEPEPLVDALAGAGHEVDDCLTTDVALAVTEKHGPEVVVFHAEVPETGGVSRRDVLRALVSRYRVILLAQKADELVPYAAALGVRDFVFVPASPADVLHRLENPATGEEAAEALAGVTLPQPEAEDQEEEEEGRRKVLPHLKLPNWRKLIRKRPEAGEDIVLARQDDLPDGCCAVEGETPPAAGAEPEMIKPETGVRDTRAEEKTDAEATLCRTKDADEKPASRVKKVLLLGAQACSLAAWLREMGVAVTSDPADASCTLADFASYGLAPDGIPLVVVGSGTVADFAVKRSRPDALVCVSLEEATAKVASLARGEVVPGGKETAADRPPRAPSLTVLPGGRASGRGQVLREHSALYVVCPSRPALAGETVISIAKSVPNAALVCGAANSTAALAMGISPETLVTADWRVPGASAPVELDGVHVWPIDPLKFLDVRESVHALVDQIRRLFSLVVVDCSGNLDLCARVQKTDGIMVLQTAGDLADRVVQHWLKNYGGPNVFTLPPGASPRLVAAENGFVVLGGEAATTVR